MSQRSAYSLEHDEEAEEPSLAEDSPQTEDEPVSDDTEDIEALIEASKTDPAKLKTGRRWCFTIFCTPDEFNSRVLPNKEKITSATKYIVWQHEKTKSGKAHVQGFIHLNKSQRFTAIKKLLGVESAVWFTPTRGTDEQNKKYCTKAASRVSPGEEWGAPVSQGTRTDLQSAFDFAMTPGMNAAKFIHSEYGSTYLRFSSGLDKIFALNQAQRSKPTPFFIFWGPTGTGKSLEANFLSKRLAKKHGTEVWWKGDCATKWFDGLQPGAVCVLDEFADNCMSIKTLLRLLDWTPRTEGE